MKLLFLLLIVLTVSVNSQRDLPRPCRGPRDCGNREVCVRLRPGPRDPVWDGRRQGVCRPRRPQANTCFSGADCRWDECCERSGRNGVCRPLQRSGRSCLTRFPSGKPASIVLQCPCTAQLTCIPDGGRIRPRGQTGICGVPRGRSCRSGSDCRWNECCSSTRAFTGQAGGRFLENGVCRPLARNGARCPTNIRPGRPSRTVRECPCESGLSCRGGRNNIPPRDFIGSFIPRGICRAPVSCRMASDCRRGECCRSRGWPRGQRGKQDTMGVCEPLADIGETCLARVSPGRPGRVLSFCPCQRGLQCRRSDPFNRPRGERGTCI